MEEFTQARPLIAPRPKPLSIWHFSNPRHWTLTSVRRAFTQGIHTLLDQAVAGYFAAQRTRRSDTYLRNIRHDMLSGLELYQQLGWLDDPMSAHLCPGPPPGGSVHIEPRRHRRVAYEHMSFPSAYQPHPDDPSGQRWQRLVENRTVHAYMLRHQQPRPWVINVHGAGTGIVGPDFMAFRSRKLFDSGVNVLHPVLPLHGPRRSHERAHFPSESMMHNVHGTLQGTADIRRAIAWIRQQQPDQPIAMHGISLGGFTTAIVASLESELAAAIIGVPPVDLILLIETHHGPGVPGDEREQNFDIGARLSVMLTPLRLTPQIPRHRRFIYAGITDQLVDYADNVAPMIPHWDYPEVLVFDGGHLGAMFTPEVHRFVDEALRKSGILS